MITVKYPNIEIAGIAAAVPDAVERLEKYVAVFGQEAVDKFTSMTGVITRHIAAQGQTTSDLCFAAAKELIKNADIDAGSIGAVVFVSQTPDYRLPATACELSARLGCGEDCIAFDINLGCSGYVYGVSVVSALMQGGNIDRALLLAGDTISKLTDPMDKGTAMLFGDAGSTTLLEKRDTAREGIEGAFRTNGKGFRAIMQEGLGSGWRYGDGAKKGTPYLTMDGEEVMSFTVNEVPSLIKQFMKAQGRGVQDYDALVLHQANGMIMKQIARLTRFPMDKVPLSIGSYGNTSAASIPLTLCANYSNYTGPLNALMCGYGVGLSWGVVAAEINVGCICPVVSVNEQKGGWK